MLLGARLGRTGGLQRWGLCFSAAGKIHLSHQLQLGFLHKSLISETNEAFCSPTAARQEKPLRAVWSPSLFQQGEMSNSSFCEICLFSSFFKQMKNGYAKGSVLPYDTFREGTQSGKGKCVFSLCSPQNNISNLIKQPLLSPSLKYRHTLQHQQ